MWKAFVTAIAAMFVANTAYAGVADTPLPELLAGETTYHLFTVPGVLASTGLETYFACTSLEETATAQIAVELFGGAGGAPGNDAVGTSLSVGPGATVYFGTGAAVWIAINSNLGYSGSRGSARILATSKKITCTAFVADLANVPPTSMTHLTIIAKTKQKAAN